MGSKLTTAEFIKKAKTIHGDKYDYSCVDYKKSNIKVSILCPQHGLFNQRPNDHLSLRGCPVCKKEKLSELHCFSGEIFINKSKEVHGEKYDYSKVKYTSNKDQVLIVCPLHGDFVQIAANHLSGRGCSLCGIKKRAQSQSLNINEFVRRANQIHNNKYGYNRVIYHNMSSHIIISCPQHGDFKQMPVNHLAGNGCPKCKESHGEKAIRNFLIQFGLKFESQYRFKECRNKKPLPFDFSTWHNNQIYLIEFHGEQHYRPAEFGRMTFKQRKINDKIKFQWCKKHSIPLLVIPYYEFNFICKKLCEFLKIEIKWNY